MKAKKKQIQLRAHHLLCLQGYQGYGYDENFKKNMENILKNSDNLDVFLTYDIDEICNYCPNLKKNKCVLNLDSHKNYESNNTNINEKIDESNNTIIQMDLNVLKKMKINKNEKNSYKLKTLFEKTEKSFKSVSDLSLMCKGCRWEDVCLFYQSKKKN
ncbi:DUF1284 domain-containing protein [Methanobrevibacter curvatus]|uniref:DUF1284 domain-containing protein n=1 Tax=Methanobrevibacter curvatus TaxID=49547 RepID=A0A166EIM9_9EURY|nr:DUF1284 domain-containing protein [Methanobrevibacter curvatus]KZX16693.1 hypothetical protein MBCUR_00340 [Methanobrevibacter curvatus]